MPRAQIKEPVAIAESDGDESTKERLLDAAMQCFTQLGIAKTSIQDVAREAGVSRGTVYRYFVDRQALIEATVASGAQRYYAEAAAAMDALDTLAEQVGAFAEVLSRTLVEHRTRSRLMDGDSAWLRLIASDREASLRRAVDFLRPYVRAARDRGEVGRDVDEREASEWLARLVMSFTTLQTGLTFDIEKPKAVRRFVERYAVSGLRVSA
jgi:AcrR family transcriptional regulator